MPASAAASSTPRRFRQSARSGGHWPPRIRRMHRLRQQTIWQRLNGIGVPAERCPPKADVANHVRRYKRKLTKEDMANDVRRYDRERTKADVANHVRRYKRKLTKADMARNARRYKRKPMKDRHGNPRLAQSGRRLRMHCAGNDRFFVNALYISEKTGQTICGKTPKSTLKEMSGNEEDQQQHQRSRGSSGHGPVQAAGCFRPWCSHCILKRLF